MSFVFSVIQLSYWFVICSPLLSFFLSFLLLLLLFLLDFIFILILVLYSIFSLFLSFISCLFKISFFLSFYWASSSTFSSFSFCWGRNTLAGKQVTLCRILLLSELPRVASIFSPTYLVSLPSPSNPQLCF